MKNVLDAVDDHWSVEIHHIKDSLGSQKVGTSKYHQDFEPAIKRSTMDWLIEGEANRLYMRVVAIDVVVIMGVFVPCRSVSMVEAVIMRLSVSFRSEPILDIETFRFWIVMTSIEQLRWIDETILRNDLRGAGVQNPQPSLQFPMGIVLDEVRFGDQ